MIMMAVGVTMVPGMDAIAKTLTATLAPGQIAAARFLFQIIFLLPIILITSRHPMSRCPLLNICRGMLIALATLCFFWALKYLPLADTIAIFFVEPLILTLISALFLGEQVGWRRLLAINFRFRRRPFW